MKFSRQQKSFTLIEMLIVIVIIGILAAALVPRLQSVQARARDTKRKTDLKTIYNANEIFLLDNGKYARPGTGAYEQSSYFARSVYSQPWIVELTGIITTIPIDPINVTAGLTDSLAQTGAYQYIYGRVYTTNGSQWVNTYDLTAKLENILDPDRNSVRWYLNDYPASPHATGQERAYYYEYSPHSNSF